MSFFKDADHERLEIFRAASNIFSGLLPVDPKATGADDDLAERAMFAVHAAACLIDAIDDIYTPSEYGETPHD